MREIGGTPAEDWHAKRADSAERKLKNLREDLEKRVAALEARPQGVPQSSLKKQFEAVIAGLAPAIREAIEEYNDKALAPIRKENEILKQRICFLEGRESATRAQ